MLYKQNTSCILKEQMFTLFQQERDRITLAIETQDHCFEHDLWHYYLTATFSEIRHNL